MDILKESNFQPRILWIAELLIKCKDGMQIKSTYMKISHHCPEFLRKQLEFPKERRKPVETEDQETWAWGESSCRQLGSAVWMKHLWER